MSLIAAAGSSQVIRASGLEVEAYRIVSADDGSVVSGPISTGITNTAPLRYKATATVPAFIGSYEIQWDDGSGVWQTLDELTVVSADGTLPGTAEHTLGGGPWPTGTTVSVYRRLSPLPLQAAAPPSPLVTSADVSSAHSVTFTGLDYGQKYWAIGNDEHGTPRWVSFFTD